jgi:hypothetical protein
MMMAVGATAIVGGVLLLVVFLLDRDPVTIEERRHLAASQGLAGLPFGISF